jgi:hypothetical protein
VARAYGTRITAWLNPPLLFSRRFEASECLVQISGWLLFQKRSKLGMELGMVCS